MATVFKQFLQNDVTNTKTLLHEAIPLTGSVVSGTYGTWASETNIKNYSHGLFQSVYDYPFLSSSANHIFDLSVGFSSRSALSASTPVTQQVKKINIYSQMAQVLMGYDHTGSIQEFDQDGDIVGGGTKMRECIFINFARLLYKDEIKKGSFTIKLGNNPEWTGSMHSQMTITDAGAQNNYRVNSPAGEYAILSCSSGAAANKGNYAGLIFYQAGIVVLTASVFATASDGFRAKDAEMTVNGDDINGLLTGSQISSSCDSFRHWLYDISFNNTTELNSSIYFCRISHNDFNYSSNPTYLSSSKMVVKNNSTDEPVTYVTTIGLYSSDNELLAVAKLSEPLKKTPSTELTIRARLDY